MEFFLLILSSLLTGTLGVATCGGNITAEVPRYTYGTPFSQIHLLSGPSALDVTNCKWTVTSPQKFLLNIFFVNTTIPSPSRAKGCPGDYIAIRKYDAANKTFESLRPYCGERELAGIRINGSVEITMHFTRDAVNGSLMSMTVRVEASSKDCGGIFNRADAVPLIHVRRSKFLISKTDFVHCTWHFELDEGKNLTLFLLKKGFYYDSSSGCQSDKDFLSILSWNDKSATAKQLNTICNVYDYQLPRQYTLRQSRRFTVTVHFEYRYGLSDGLTEATCFLVSKGFMKTVTFSSGVLSGNVSYNTNNLAPSKIDGILHLNEMSSDYYILISPARLLCRYGFLQLWTLNNDALQINKTICSSTKGNLLSLSSAGQVLWLQFRAQASHLKGIRIHFFPKQSMCGGVYYLQAGHSFNLTSPNYGSGDYPANSFCRWVLLANGTTTLNVSVLDMQLQSCDNKFYDYVELYDQFLYNATLRHKLCKKPAGYLLTKGDIEIHFHSSWYSHHSGFKLLITTKQECGGTYWLVPGQSIELFSPNFGTGLYPAFSSCEWRLFANESTTRLTIWFPFMDLEPCSQAFYDYVQVYEGIEEGLKLRQSLCTVIPGYSIEVDGNMTIRFVSDGTVTRSGFKIRVNATRVQDHVTTTQMTSSRPGYNTSPGSNTSPSPNCCKTDPGTKATSKNVTTRTAVTKKFASQSSSNVAAYTAGIIGGLVLICALVFAGVYFKRHREHKANSSSDIVPKGTAKSYSKKQRPLEMTNLENMSHEKSLPIVGSESENPYYRSTLKPGSDVIYCNSAIDNPEAVYAEADEAAVLYSIPTNHNALADYAFVPNETRDIGNSDNNYSCLDNSKASENRDVGNSDNNYSCLDHSNTRSFQVGVYDHLNREAKSDIVPISDSYDILQRVQGYH